MCNNIDKKNVHIREVILAGMNEKNRSLFTIQRFISRKNHSVGIQSVHYMDVFTGGDFGVNKFVLPFE